MRWNRPPALFGSAARLPQSGRRRGSFSTAPPKKYGLLWKKAGKDRLYTGVNLHPFEIRADADVAKTAR
ncbi:MAG: hypothetical protein IPL27_27115 [Lewinellaceae bacterium]|nr:hypothetical protein [Lewinellaceae bacterium]